MSLPFPFMSHLNWPTPAYTPVIMSGGGSPARRHAGIPNSQDSLTFHSQNVSALSSQNSSDGETDFAAHAGVSIAGGSGEQLSNQFDDSPYVPPRVIHSEPHAYPSLDPNVQRQHTLYEGGTSPADSQHSGDSVWSTPSSSTSTHALPGDYLSVTSYPGTQPTRATYYPAYQGQHRLGLEHIRYGEHPQQHTGGTYYRPSPQDYMVDSLLTSEIFEDSNARVVPSQGGSYPATSSQGSSSSTSYSVSGHIPNVSTFPVSSAPLTDTGSSRYPDAGPYLRQQLGLPAHAPVGLHSIPDPIPGDKPTTPLPMLIKLAIYGSPRKQLTLQEIYNELENRFQWFREHKNDKAWKNSIRHNLSLNKVFKLVPRPITEPGKGSYWQLDVSEGEGYKRLRKRRPKNRMTASEEEDEDSSEIEEDCHGCPDPSQHAAPVRSSIAAEDHHIDPELRAEGHVVGEGRARSTSRRIAAGSPYPSQSPRYQQVPLPLIVGQDPSEAVRFGQPSFGQTAFPAFSQTQPLPATSPSASFALMSSSPTTMTPAISTARPQLQHMASYDRAAPISQPPPRPGIEYVDSRGLPAARRISGQPQGNVGHSHSHSAGSSSSGSPHTWSDARYRSQTDGR